jgi:PKHD-type hydroxylase|tara:strand:+ start:1579 stop:2130 length:552 start_codon:yes stop_codon:yes gene_type:complete
MRLKEYIWIFENELGDFFCKDVIKLGNETKKHFAYINDGKTIPDKKIRNSNVCFLSDMWIQKWFDVLFHTANKNAGWNFQFDRYESFQFTEYKKTQHYGWHPDSFLHDKIIRKLSAIIVLSDPKDYVGGEIEFKTSEGKIIKIKKPLKGTIIIFPSFVYHRVKPVKSGTRYSLVVWACGENFK